MVVRNDVRSDVAAQMYYADVTAASPLRFDHDAADGGSVVVESGQRVRGADGSIFEYLGDSSEIDLGSADFTDAEQWRAIGAIDVLAFENATIAAQALAAAEASGGSRLRHRHRRSPAAARPSVNRRAERCADATSAV
jgi:hypothetical protein